MKLLLSTITPLLYRLDGKEPEPGAAFVLLDGVFCVPEISEAQLAQVRFRPRSGNKAVVWQVREGETLSIHVAEELN